MFTLHPQLVQDTFLITDQKFCRVLLMNNSLFPWLILVPRADNVKELIDLPESDRYMLMDEISLAAEVIKSLFKPDKLNIAALGNQVPQLHIHVIARFRQDAAWPHPVWGRGSKIYDEPASLIDVLKKKFAR